MIKIPGFKDYYVNEFGSVFSNRTKILKKMKGSINKFGYLEYRLKDKKGVSNTKKLNTIMKNSFFNIFDDNITINHIDGNKQNNHIGNLELMTFSENTKHAYRTGLSNTTGENNGRAKLTEKQVICARKLLEANISVSDVASFFNVGITAISYIKHGKAWKHL